MASKKRRPKTADLDEKEDRQVLFFYAQSGSFKKIYNTNCRCNVLLDAIRRDVQSTLGALLNTRIGELATEIEGITKQIELEELKKKMEHEANGNKEAAESDDHKEGDSPPSRGGKEDTHRDKKDHSSSRSRSRTHDSASRRHDRKHKKKEPEDEEEDPASYTPEEEQRAALRKEHEARVQENGVLQGLANVDLFDHEGTPLNLRQSPDAYAKTLLRPNRVYTIVTVESGPEGLVQQPLDISI